MWGDGKASPPPPETWTSAAGARPSAKLRNGSSWKGAAAGDGGEVGWFGS